MGKQYIFLWFFMCAISLGNAQTKLQKKLDKMEISAKDAGVDIATISKIKELVLQREQKLKQYHQDWALQDATSIVYFNDRSKSPNEIHRKFKEDLAQLITIHQFGQMFSEFLKPIIDGKIGSEWEAFSKPYTLTKKQEKILYNLVSYYTKEHVLRREYYKYDPGLAHTKVSELRNVAGSAYEQALLGLGLMVQVETGGDSKLQYLIAKAKEAGVSNTKINALVTALQYRNDKIKAVDQEFRKFDKKYAIYFHDHKHSKKNYKSDFRKTMASLISYDQFKSMFYEQLKSRIERQAERRFQEVIQGYKLSSEQAKEIRVMLGQQTIKEVTTKEYYGYNHKLSMQKLRALQYKFENAFKEKLEAFETP